jgi:nitrite reductase/ring-hydroxylating ferredoxin subunit
MNRYTFLKNMGFRGAALMAVLSSCVNPDDTYVPALTVDANGQPISSQPTSTTAPTSTTVAAAPSTTGTTADVLAVKNPLLTITLAGSAVGSVGGYVTQSGIVVAQVSAGKFAAVTQTCSHEPKRQVMFNKTEFYCTAHGARFDLTGKGLNSLGISGIKAYKTISDGKIVVVYA